VPDAAGSASRAALAERAGELADRRVVTVGVAESLTGGHLSADLAAAPRASEWFRGGVVAYASEVKYEVLGVARGPVVTETAALGMAAGACRLLGADVAVAVTGVGGPDPQDGVEPGTVWIALRHDGRHRTRLERFTGDPESVIDATCRVALALLVDALHARDDGG